MCFCGTAHRGGRAFTSAVRRMDESMGEQIGFIGLGQIGLPIALNLARAGHTLVPYDVAPRPDSVEQLEKAGARQAADLAAVVQGSDIVITSLPDSAAVETVILSDAVRSKLRRGMVWVEMSSGYPADTRRFAQILEEAHGVELVDAPVCDGGVPAAWEARLTLCLGGSEAAVRRVRPILSDVASDIVHVGPVGQGHIMKLLSNFIKLATCGVVANAYTIAQASGMQLEAVSETLRHCVASKFVNLDAAEGQLLSMPSEGPPLFRLALARKDLRYLAAHAATSGVFSPLADGAHALYLVAERTGFADAEDVQGAWRALQEMLPKSTAGSPGAQRAPTGKGS
ncbi:MAG: NAD(P)-dependent oxidoreductase [Candidatus Dormibacteria bacterium]